MNRHRSAAVLSGILVLVALALPARRAAAQVPHLDGIPWSAVADTTARGGPTFAWDLLAGSPSSWRAERVGLGLRMAVGDAAVVVLRGRYIRFETAGRPVLVRWPHLMGEDDEGEPAVSDGWPGETNIEDFGQPEVGVLLPLAMPWLGPGDAAAFALLPFGKDELYPMASRALVLRADWRRREVGVGPVALSARVGWEFALDASGDVFDPAAFPDGFRFGVTVGAPLGRPRGVVVGWSARELSDGRHLRRAEAAAWAPMAGGHRLRVSLVRELGGRAHRIADWRLGVELSLGGLPSSEDDPRKTP